MESTSQDYKAEMENSAPEVIEIYDIFLTDGTHLRYTSYDQDINCVDFEE